MSITWRQAIHKLLAEQNERGLVHYVDLAAALGERWPYQFGVSHQRTAPQATVWRELNSDESFALVGAGLFHYLPWGAPFENMLRLSRDGGKGLRTASGALRDSRKITDAGLLEALLDDPKRRAAEVALRRAALEQARRLILEPALDAEGIAQLMQLWSTTGGRQLGHVLYNRFAPALIGTSPRTYQEHLVTFNDWMHALRFACGEPQKILATLDTLWARNDLPLAGKLLPSLILHTLEPAMYFPWSNPLAEGLQRAGFGEDRKSDLGDAAGALESTSGACFVRYCDGVRAYLETTGCDAHLADFSLMRERARGPVSSELFAPRSAKGEMYPAFVPSAFLLLRDIASTQSAQAEWFARRRVSYRRAIRQPLEQLVHVVATRVIEPLLHAPRVLGGWAIETDPARVIGRVSAPMPRPNGSRYQPYLSATFFPRAQGRRQQAVKLFLLVHPEGLDVGLSLEGAPLSSRERLRHALSTSAKRIVAHLRVSPFWPRLVLRGLRPDPEPDPDSDRDSQAAVASVQSIEQLCQLGEREDRTVLAIPFTREEAGRREIDDWVTEAVRSLAPLFAVSISDAPDEVLDALGIARGIEDLWPDPPSDPPGEEDVPTGYSWQELQRDTGMPLPWLEQVVRAACVGPDRDELGQGILYGPAGTGKTWIAEHIALHLADGDRSRVQLVQFHPSFSYEHFIEGYRPEIAPDGSSLLFRCTDGVLLDLVGRIARTGKRHVLVIDEMNRGDLPQIFGELMYLLSRRREQTSVLLARSGRPLSLPRELSIIATMNTADRSIAHMDWALRRRFRFFEVAPNPGLVTERLLAAGVDDTFAGTMGDLLSEINHRLAEEAGSGGLQIGHAYFFDVHSREGIKTVWEREIFPLIEDVLDHQPERLAPYRWPSIARLLTSFAEARGKGEEGETPL